jgi:hypothetical protein
VVTFALTTGDKPCPIGDSKGGVRRTMDRANIGLHRRLLLLALPVKPGEFATAVLQSEATAAKVKTSKLLAGYLSLDLAEIRRLRQLVAERAEALFSGS